MKKRLLAAGLCLCIAAAAVCGRLVAKQRALAGKLIRFHVVAASDSEGDQARKLAVRDALLQRLEPLSRQAQSREQMAALLQDSLPQLKADAESTLRQHGCTDPVTVCLQNEAFPTRYYDTFALPAGEYLSLRVKIGDAAGHNWWCVCFPTLCSAACSDSLATVAAGAGFTDGEIDWITNCDRYEIRFKVLEWLQALRDRP